MKDPSYRRSCRLSSRQYAFCERTQGGENSHTLGGADVEADKEKNESECRAHVFNYRKTPIHRLLSTA